MSEEQEAGGETNSEVERAVEEVREIERALDEGRAPRGRRPLREAARVLQAAERYPDAVHALHVLVRLEQRRGDEPEMLKAARAALRAARQGGGERDIGASLDTLAAVLASQGEYAAAERLAAEALGRAEAASEPTALARALARMALVRVLTGDEAAGLTLAEEALENATASGDPALAARTERVWAGLLILAGCPAAAQEHLTRVVQAPATAAEGRRAMLARGWAWVCQGRPEAGARDFRKVWRLARDTGDRVMEIEAASALAAANLRREGADAGSSRRARAEAAAERTVRQSQRLGEPRLERLTQELWEWAGGRAPDASDRPSSPRAAAQALVELARKTESALAVAACRREVERLSRLPADAVPYHGPPDLRLALDLLRVQS